MLKIQSIHISFSQTLCIDMAEVIQSSSEVLTSLISPLFDDINSTSLSYHLLMQTLISAYQLSNNALPNCFKKCWLCIPPESNSQPPFMASPTVLLDSPTLQLVNCSESSITTTPYLSHISLFGIANCSNSSGTHLMGTLDSAACNNTTALSTATQTICPNIHSAFQFSVAHKNTTAYLLGGQGLNALVFLFSKLGVVPGEDPSPIPITKFIAAQHDKQVIQVIPFWQPWV